MRVRGWAPRSSRRGWCGLRCWKWLRALHQERAGPKTGVSWWSDGEIGVIRRLCELLIFALLQQTEFVLFHSASAACMGFYTDHISRRIWKSGVCRLEICWLPKGWLRTGQLEPRRISYDHDSFPYSLRTRKDLSHPRWLLRKPPFVPWNLLLAWDYCTFNWPRHSSAYNVCLDLIHFWRFYFNAYSTPLFNHISYLWSLMFWISDVHFLWHFHMLFLSSVYASCQRLILAVLWNLY